MRHYNNAFTINGKNFFVTEAGYIVVPTYLRNRDDIDYIDGVSKCIINQDQLNELIMDAAKYENKDNGVANIYLTESMFNALSSDAKSNRYATGVINFHIINPNNVKDYDIELDGNSLPLLPIEDVRYYMSSIPNINFIYSKNSWHIFIKNIYQDYMYETHTSMSYKMKEIYKSICAQIKTITEIIE